MISLILKTSKGFEKIVATHVMEKFPDLEVIPRPNGYSGIVFVKGGDPEKLYELVLEKIPEVEKALPVYGECSSTIEEISKMALKASEKFLKPGESFAVRTTRRGKHDFTSLDVNVEVGARIKEKFANPVNLDNPDKVIWVEIFGDKAYISITEEQSLKKPKADIVLKISKKISFVQMPFLGDLEAAYRMGVRIGRAAQAFEIGELVIAPTTIVDGLEFKKFLDGVFEGRNSRFEVQKKSYSRKVDLVPVKIYDIFQLARSRFGEVFIVTSARGKPLDEEICKKIVDLFEKENRITIFAGSREGVPTGILRWGSIVLNLAPGITFATEHTIPTTITSIITCFQLVYRK